MPPIGLSIGDTPVISAETVGPADAAAPTRPAPARSAHCRRRRSPPRRRSSRRRRPRRAWISRYGESSSTNALPAASMRNTRPGDSVPASSSPSRANARRDDVGGVGAVERGALAVGGDLVDDALVAGGGKQVAGAIDRERPDVLVVGIEEGARRAVGGDVVDAAVGRGADVEPAVRRRRDGMDFELAGVEARGDLAVLPTRSSLPSLPLPAHSVPSLPACSVQRNGAEVSATTDADGPSSMRPSLSIERSCDVALEEVGLRADRPEGRGRGADDRDRSRPQTARAAAAARNFSMR